MMRLKIQSANIVIYTRYLQTIKNKVYGPFVQRTRLLYTETESALYSLSLQWSRRPMLQHAPYHANQGIDL
jgi:hypothetical protein